jgi:dihydropteroate synthase
MREGIYLYAAHKSIQLPQIMNSMEGGRSSGPVVMGVLNATPDSFFSRGHGADSGTLGLVEKMLKDGAAIIDIGGASTRPGQQLIGSDEELERIMPLLERVCKEFPQARISVDTYNAATAKAAVAAGAAIINDISGGAYDEEMLATVAQLKVPYIAMHIQGTPATMQADPRYTDVVGEVKAHLAGIVERCAAAGISDVIIDPGFGFGKTVAHNYRLLGQLRTFKDLGRPILAGLSRKSMICKPLHVNPDHALNGTTALNMVALQQGADILRVHDVKEAVEVVKLFHELKEANAG